MRFSALVCSGQVIYFYSTEFNDKHKEENRRRYATRSVFVRSMEEGMMNATKWMSREEAAAYINLKPRTLAVWASAYWRKNNGKMPIPLYKLGGRVRYIKEDLDLYIDSQRRQ